MISSKAEHFSNGLFKVVRLTAGNNNASAQLMAKAVNKATANTKNTNDIFIQIKMAKWKMTVRIKLRFSVQMKYDEHYVSFLLD